MLDGLLQTRCVGTPVTVDRLTGVHFQGREEWMSDATSDDPLHILLVEDNPGDVRLTKEAFRSIERDVEFHVVTDGRAAIQYAHGHLRPDAESRPDLILLDLNLPRIDGFDVLDTLEEDIDAPPPPVLILSSSTAEGDIERSYEKGCSAYLTKPDDVGNYAKLAQSIKDFWCDWVQPPVASP